MTNDDLSHTLKMPECFHNSNFYRQDGLPDSPTDFLIFSTSFYPKTYHIYSQQSMLPN